MKTKEELNAIKKEVEILNKKLAELTEDELVQVTGGIMPYICAENGERLSNLDNVKKDMDRDGKSQE